MYPSAAKLVGWYRPCQFGSLALGAIACAGMAIGGYFNPEQFFRAYLAAYLFVLGLSLGSMAVLMIYHTTGGAWGFLIRRFLEAGVRTLPLVALGFVPIACGISYLYPWAMPGAAEKSELIAGQSIYLNEPFFYGRAVGYFTLWLLLGLGLSRWSIRQDRTQNPSIANWLDGISGIGLLIFGVSLHFAAVDWVMTLQPMFHSTIFGPIVVVGQILSAYALAVIALCLLGARSPIVEVIAPKSMNDLGNLLLSFTVVWGYLCWFQYLLGWIANLPYDAVWYVPRLHDGWQWLALTLILFHFALPVLVLLWRAAKRSRVVLGSTAALLLLMQLVFDYYQVIPPFHAYGLREHWMDFVAPIALGGIWLAFYLWRLAPYPVLPEYDFNESSAVHLRKSDEEEEAWEGVFSHG